MSLIGVSGYAGAGKDTFANVLVQKYGFERIAFADLLKQVVYTLNPIVDPIVGFRVHDFVDDYGWDYAKQNVPEIRRLLQRMGTEAGRDILGQDIWVDAVFNNMGSGDYCISDMRFPNEAQRVVDNNGVTVRIIRDGIIPANNHPGEVALDNWDFDYIVYNNHGIDNLEEMADKILNKVG